MFAFLGRYRFALSLASRSRSSGIFSHFCQSFSDDCRGKTPKDDTNIKDVKAKTFTRVGSALW